MPRVSCPILRSRLTTAEEAAAFVSPGDNVGMSGFTGAGYPKAVPTALAARMTAAHERGDDFRIGLWTGASTAPEADGVLAEAHGISTRLPYNSDPALRRLINSGEIDYVDAHLSHCAQQMWFDLYGRLNVAVVEVTAVLGDGLLVPAARWATTRPGSTRRTGSSWRSITGSLASSRAFTMCTTAPRFHRIGGRSR